MSSYESPNLMQRHQIPSVTLTFGLAIFLLSAGILFVSIVLGYLLVRFMFMPADAPSVHVPGALYLSTFILIVSSYTIQVALSAIRREHQDKFRRNLVVTSVLGYAFLILQAPAMWTLMQEHLRLRANDLPAVQGMIVCLVVVHALHVIGGLGPLTLITYRALHDRYDHEYFGPIKRIAIYWHFLDSVWLIMFALFLFG